MQDACRALEEYFRNHIEEFIKDPEINNKQIKDFAQEIKNIPNTGLLRIHNKMSGLELTDFEDGDPKQELAELYKEALIARETEAESLVKGVENLENKNYAELVEFTKTNQNILKLPKSDFRALNKMPSWTNEETLERLEWIKERRKELGNSLLGKMSEQWEKIILEEKDIESIDKLKEEVEKEKQKEKLQEKQDNPEKVRQTKNKEDRKGQEGNQRKELQEIEKAIKNFEDFCKENNLIMEKLTPKNLFEYLFGKEKDKKETSIFSQEDLDYLKNIEEESITKRERIIKKKIKTLEEKKKNIQNFVEKHRDDEQYFSMMPKQKEIYGQLDLQLKAFEKASEITKMQKNFLQKAKSN